MIQTLQSHFEDIIWPERYRFLATFLAVLTVSYGFLVAIDFVPEPVAEESESGRYIDVAHAEEAASPAVDDEELIPTVAEVATEPVATPEAPTAVLPVRMVIDALDREIDVLNPTSRRVADLDEALRSGAVRHPDAADFAREGNIFILGHSSHLPNVLNRNYQIFNGIENLQWGDTIRLYSDDTEYIYRVERVYEAKASEATIEIAGTGPRLTLATCDSFGSIDDRYIVEAYLQTSRPL